MDTKETLSRIPTKEEVCNLFMSGIDCSQVVTGLFAEETGMDADTLRRMSAAFGGGMSSGETCGAVTGALMVIGLLYGSSRENDAETKALMTEKALAFRQEFTRKYGSCMCRDLLGHDISKPGQMDAVLAEGTMFSLCPELVRSAVAILEDLIK